MMKLAVTALSLFLVLNPSQAKTSVTAQVQESPKHFVLKTPTRTKNVLARAIPKAQRRLLITDDLSDADDGPPGPDELSLHGPYARSRFKAPLHDTEELSDYVLVRLAIARARAMDAYRKKWA